MAMQSYLDNIKAMTGQTPEGFKQLMESEGVFREDLKAAELVSWLKERFDLGHGHSMAIWSEFKEHGWVKGLAKK